MNALNPDLERCPACRHGQPWLAFVATTTGPDDVTELPYTCMACNGSNYVTRDRVKLVEQGLILQAEAREFHRQTGGLLADFAAVERTTPQRMMQRLLGEPPWLQDGARAAHLAPAPR